MHFIGHERKELSRDVDSSQKVVQVAKVIPQYDIHRYIP